MAISPGGSSPSMTAAQMAVISTPEYPYGGAELKRATEKMPAIAASTPERMYTPMRTPFTLMPEKRAAFSLLPT
jgi:hypothetical protein